MGIEFRAHLQTKPIMEYDINMVELEELIPHEMTIAEELEHFKEGIVIDGTIFYPILVDKESQVILDGHHRQAGLIQLGYKNIPVVYLNYLDDSIVQLATWFPLVDRNPDDVVKELAKNGLQIEEGVSYDACKKLLENREITAIIGNEDKMYHAVGEREEIFKIVREQWLEGIRYYDYDKYCIRDARDDKTAIISWPYRKREILDKVKEGIIFYPKTTRHILTYRQKRCDIPLTNLNRL
ncbi:MAG: hypothetical protein ACXAD7_07260 [Candidatus Kariarchaeaceae archaeon]